MSRMYCAEVQVDRRKVDDEQLQAILGALESYHPSARAFRGPPAARSAVSHCRTRS